MGAGAELAVASYMGLERYLYADKTPVRDSCDLPGIDVKCRSRHYYDLLLHLDDVPSKTFVLVTIENRKTFIHGWIRGHEGMRQDLVKEYAKGRLCYAVPQSMLYPMEQLKVMYNDYQEHLLCEA
jgi:hypothetical protein